MPVLVGILVVFLVVVFVAFARSVAAWRAEQLRRFARRLEGAVAHVVEGFFSSWDGSWVSGRLDGRRVRLVVDVRGSGKHQVTYLIYSLEVANPVTQLEVRPAGVLSRLGRWLGVVEDHPTGNARLDGDFIFRRLGRRGASLDVFRSGAMERELRHLFEALEFTELQLTDHELIGERVLRRDPMLEERELHRAFKALERLALLCERTKIKVQVSPKVDVDRFAWTLAGRLSCPFCRDGLDPAGDGDGERAVACGSCQTLLHAACLEEAGGCVVFGCDGGRRTVRA